MSGEEWDWLFHQAKTVSLMWTTSRGVQLSKAIWVERDRNDIVFIAWSGDLMTQALEGEPAVELIVESYERIIRYAARAMLG